jgi:hypothetical protein
VRANAGSFDVEILNGSGCHCPISYEPRFYTAENSTVAVSGGSDQGVGRPGRNGVCVSGQVTRAAVCGMRVTGTNASVCLREGGCLSQLMTYTNGSTSATQRGDSGGPVYFINNSNGKAHVIGMHIGKSGTTYYAEKFSSVAGFAGATIKTG